MLRRVGVTLGVLLLTACSTTVRPMPVTSIDRAPPELLSAFFGLDNALPAPANFRLCLGAAGRDGMPVVFSHEVDVQTLEPGDFRVTTASGAIGEVTCLTLAPADDALFVDVSAEALPGVSTVCGSPSSRCSVEWAAASCRAWVGTDRRAEKRPM